MMTGRCTSPSMYTERQTEMAKDQFLRHFLGLPESKQHTVFTTPSADDSGYCCNDVNAGCDYAGIKSSEQSCLNCCAAAMATCSLT